MRIMKLSFPLKSYGKNINVKQIFIVDKNAERINLIVRFITVYCYRPLPLIILFCLLSGATFYISPLLGEYRIPGFE